MRRNRIFKSHTVGRRSTVRAKWPGWAIFALLVAAAGCASEGAREYARALEITSLDQAPGGPTANARVGDFLIENDKIRVVIEQGSISYHPADVGGSVIDIDLQRPEAEFRAGRGLDQLGQIAPIANLQMAQALASAHVRITGTTEEGAAEVTTAVVGEPVYRILIALSLLIDQRFVPDADFNMYNEHQLRPGESMLRVVTTVGFDVPFCRPEEGDGCNAECDDILYDDDCECAVPARCTQGVEVQVANPLPDRPISSLLDTMLGDLPRPLGTGSCVDQAECAAGELCVPVTTQLGGAYNVCRPPAGKDPGVFLGDLLIFGGNVRPFIPGTGYDTETDIRRLFDQGEDTLARPMEIDAVYATGDRISYGYVSPDGAIQAPIFSGPFSMGATHAVACAADDPDCLSSKLIRFERWVPVGTGDVASVQASVYAAKGTETGRVQGRVIQIPDATPVSDVSVYALHDPRTLECGEACQGRPECALPDGGVEEWSVEQLMAANRCRTIGGVFVEGQAAVVSFALTDPGTDPRRDGNYFMDLLPGDYVLFAVDGIRARSSLVPVTIAVDGTIDAPLSMPEPGVLEYAIFDEWGQLSPGHVTIGTCLPGDACTSNADCTDGDQCIAGTCSCEWETFVPLELGGARPTDGIVTKDQTTSGWGRVELPPGEYQLLFSRGPHYSIDRQEIIIDKGLTTQTEASVRRVVDRIGWASANFHLHTTNSMDSGTSVGHRVAGLIAEDIDFLSSSDHDWITEYESTVEELGLSDLANTQVGVEITTQEYGHYMAFPIDYQAWKDGERLTSNNTIQWRGLPPQQILDAARALPVGDLPVLTDIPHPYDYFEFYRLNPVTIEPTESLLSTINAMLDSSFFTADYDALELVNSKAYSRIRRPTLTEIQFYSQGLDALIAQYNGGEITAQEYERALFDLSMESIRGRLHRSKEEQDAFLAGAGAEVDCSCGGDGDCAAGLVCDLSTMACVLPAEVTGDPPITEPGMCRKYRGVIDDWFNMLNRGVFRTGLSGSDVHGRENGNMRTFLRTDDTTAPYLDSRGVIDAVLRRQAVVSNGPMVHFTMDGTGGNAGVGDVLDVPSGGQVTLNVRIEKAHWYDVDRVEIYRNGELIHWARGCNSTRGEDDPHGHPCMQTGDDAVVAWEETMTDSPTIDSWYVVLAYGLDGRSLAPVYTSRVLSSIGTPEITQAIYDIIPILREFRNPRYPSVHPVLPFGFTNPIQVDIDGNGWLPPWTPPSWCMPERDYGC